MKKTLLLFIAVGYSFLLFGQQYPLFSNYVLNDFGFNPAIAGSKNYWEARGTYRTQWVGLEDAPQTQIISLQGPTKFAGVGGYFYNDQAGKLRRTGGSGALCYSIDIDSSGSRKIGIGFAYGMYNFRLMNDAAVGSDPALAESAGGQWKSEANAGIFLNWDNYFLGFSIPQLMKTELSFNDNPDLPASDLVPHYYGMIGMRQKLNDRVTIEPSVLLKYFNNAPIQFDLTARALIDNKFWAGAGVRYKDAAVAMLGYNITQSLNLAYAYDVTFTDIRAASSGSHEISLGYRFNVKKDRDGDGIADKDDDCPDDPGGGEDGCPTEDELLARADDDDLARFENDKDGDGVLDDLDDCPEVPGLIELKGCPEGMEGIALDEYGNPIDDKDRDGIRDAIDKCPEIYGVIQNAGCPIDDRDMDGIVDSKDNCPTIPGTIAKQGCPDDDWDGDTIVDAEDVCPRTPGPISNNGCPIATEAEKAILSLAIQNLYFDTNKSKIKEHSYPFLDKLAELLIVQQDYRVRIEGHTDSRGSDEFNMDLSRRRAIAVKDYLVGRGVSKKQLETEYYGEREPAASNISENTRRLNRRVEMSFIWN